MDFKSVAIAVITLIFSTSTNAAIINGYGMYASTSTASNCPSYCTTAGGGDFQYDSDGGEFSTLATSSENSYASASASAEYTGLSSTYLPILNVNTLADSGKGGFATAFGTQGYTYIGSDTTIILDFNLHGSAGDNSPGYADNNLSASIAVIIGSSLSWYPDYGTLVYEVANPNDVVGNESVFISDGLDQNRIGSISFDAINGMNFYVVASMKASSINGFADGSNTLTMQFQDDFGLTAATVSTVPVPAALWLFGSGFIGLIGIARRKKV